MISLVLPAYNEEENIPELYRRITTTASSWAEPFEIIVVDDGSQDKTFQMLGELANSDSNLKVLRFSRNFGHQAAVSAGLQYASGDIVCVMDADLQDPPEELLPFLNKIREGFDVVYAIRTKRKEGFFKLFSYKLYYRMLRRLATIDIPIDAGDFCVMSKEVVHAINLLPERNRFVRGLRTWVGFKQTGLAYERASRFAGEPKYTFSRLLRLALDGIINFSYRPLQLITISGLCIAGFSILLGLGYVVLHITGISIYGYSTRSAAAGFTSVILVLLFSSAIQLISLGILGEYIGRLYEETKRRPIFILSQKLNFPHKDHGE